MQSSGRIVVFGIAGLLLLLFLSIIAILGEDERPAPALACRPGEDAETAAHTRESVPDEYWEAIEAAAAHSGISTDVLAAQIQQESGWNASAESPAGARGIAQFMPGTAAQYGVDPLDPIASIEAQGRYMADLQEEVGSLASSERELIELTLAAYNAGPGAVQQHGGIPPFAETQHYVETIMESAQGNFSANCAPPGGFSADVGDLGPGEWTHPLPGGIVTSRFGPRPCPVANALNCHNGVSDHRGIDIATPPPGSTIVAPMELEIRAVGTQPGLGETVLAIMTEEPYLHVEFGHCRYNSFYVSAGDVVPAGTPLCHEGTTGNSAGIHLHLQFGTPDGAWDQAGWDNLIDPEPFLRAKGIL